MTSREIREKFLKYFEGKGHVRVESASLVPQNDPTLFFVNAGMVPFKDVFTGKEKRPYTRAVSSQKCLRVSGKHNDLENVGRTPRHHTFFEMLGNFSFGDYFKEEAIACAWEFLAKVAGIPEDPLWVTVFEKDDEAKNIWLKKVGIPGQKIIACGEADNFWSMGDTGPCGPCSEIHIDLGKFLGGKASRGSPATCPDDFMEIWNLVFMQFNRDAEGRMTQLPHPSIDTGMGLERLAAVLQKKKSNYDTDLFAPLIRAVASLSGKLYGKNSDDDVSMRVVADHVRAVCFLISDGVLPSNEGRGYVLRRIMRRAIRHGKMLGFDKPFFQDVSKTLIGEMAQACPELEKNSAFVLRVIRSEEEKFLETLEKGLEIMDVEIKRLKGSAKKVVSGELAFKLYDTYGFPADLTLLIAGENGMTVDMESFDREMKDQKNRARSSWKGSGAEKVGEVYHKLAGELKKTVFAGYETLTAESTVTAIVVDGQRVESSDGAKVVEVFTDKTPFYGESGGQVGDRGIIESKNWVFEVEDTQKPVEGLVGHIGRLKKGKLKIGDKVVLKVSDEWRRPVMLNHTATHILHAALREILGKHVRQAGSLVEPERLRFDFSHYEALTPKQIEKLEVRVNEVILANYKVAMEEMSLKEAEKKGAIAFFGEKYGKEVRVVNIGPYSMEFCGGTHLNFSGEIGLFKITGESSIAAGIRRIEAVTGAVAFRKFQELEKNAGEWAALLKTTPADFPARLAKLSERVRELESEVSKLKTRLASGGVGGVTNCMEKVQTINGVRFLAFEADIDDPKILRSFSDQVKGRLGSGIAVIGSRGGGKASLIVTVSPDLTGKYHAGKLISEIAVVVGGKGGGRPDMAEAGGNLPDKLPEAFRKMEELI